jgi:hypothetical protein
MSRPIVPYAVFLAALVAVPNPCRAQAQPQTREGFFIGVGVGLGSFGCEGCGNRETGIAGHLELGGTVGPSLLLGLETTGWTKERGGARLTQTNVSAIAQYYPVAASGLFLRAGVGVSWLEASASTGSFTVTAGDGGLGLTGGLGYDVRLAPNLSISPYAMVAWGDVAGGGADNLQIGAGVTWH